ncbi:MAG: NADH-quinone oxidoreductase subunit NuoE [Acidobacteriota bacterium]
MKSVDISELKEKIDPILDKYGKRKDALIAILQDVQSEFNWLPQEALDYLSKKLGIFLSNIFSIATFYTSFRLKPRGKHSVTVCLGTACHVRGAPHILEELERKLNIKEGETTEDNMFTLESVNCLGACALGPIVVVDDEYFGQMNKTKIDDLTENLRNKKE